MATQKICLGISNPKSPANMGSILRAAGCFGAQKIYYTGRRYEYAKKFATDTKQAGDQVAQIHCDKFADVFPAGMARVAVELVEGASPLPHFAHPEQAFYLFGPEDGSIAQADLDLCDHVLYLPTSGCLNLAATVNIVLYDRMAKSKDTRYGDQIIRQSRDNNNTTRIDK